MDELDSSERKYIKRYFNTMIAPVLSPQVVDSHHPFPHLEGKVLHIAVLLSHKKNERLGLIPCRPPFRRSPSCRTTSAAIL